MGQKRPTAAVPRLGAHKNNFSGGASKDGCLNPSTRPHGRVLGPGFTIDGCQERPTFTHRSAGEASPTLKAPTTATNIQNPMDRYSRRRANQGDRSHVQGFTGVPRRPAEQRPTH